MSVEGLLTVLTWAGLPAPVREHRFHAVRRWRLDLAWPDAMLAVEVDGGMLATTRRDRLAWCSRECWETARGKRRRRDAETRQDAIDRFCGGCEPEGLCRMADCTLRAWSPLPFVPLSRATARRIRA